MDHYDCHQNTKFDIKQTFFDNSNKSHEFEIKFEFSFNFEILNWILRQENSITPLEFIGHGGPSLSFDPPPLVVTVGESSSWDIIREAVGKSIGNHLPHNEINNLMDLVREVVRKNFNTETLPRYGVLGLACKIFVEHLHVYGVESDCNRMVPAADSSFKLLEKYEAVDEKSCCSICLEELGGGGGGGEVLRMPCLHVFHGGCIKKWLRRSHYCPLCRYEMPTEDI
ncbi:hypothetical protein C2S53_008720 [Perilla frutescens var. hirtella]|uniref:RING-type E3 ubiquitin transferase n=1 Tax=Perilla frutescens var. hirtella TaxID=608512 RepID=A0AAD4P3A8_PERFH|nr:hypothetical protein C2S53_008720 [Perilla frutescens var. hirtella]